MVYRMNLINISILIQRLSFFIKPPFIRPRVSYIFVVQPSPSRMFPKSFTRVTILVFCDFFELQICPHGILDSIDHVVTRM